jgi:two-component system OmpR family sensor kinase
VKSIRVRLLIGLLASVLVLQIVAYLLIFARIEDEIDELFDAELERSAYAVDIGSAPLRIPTPIREVENPQEGMVIAVWRKADTAPVFQSRPLEGITRAAPAGFSKRMIDGREWRLFGAKLEDRFVVAAQPADVRNSAARQISVRIILPSMCAIPIAALMIWLAVSYGLRPLVKISSALRQRSHRDLSPIDTRRLPPDIAPVAHALNELMKRLSGIMAAQRTFIADAAHELLTPLTALRLQAQLLARAEGPQRQRELMDELQGGVSRTLQLARQLLTLARHDGDIDEQPTRVDLAGIVDRIVGIHWPLAEAKEVKMVRQLPATACVVGNEEALSILISNLIENAIKYSGHGGAVRVTLQVQPSAFTVLVEDSGPGIPPDDRERVFDRFYRRGDNVVSGNGLGLAIARDIATRHGAAIVLGDSEALGGLSARVCFAAAENGSPVSQSVACAA